MPKCLWLYIIVHKYPHFIDSLNEQKYDQHIREVELGSFSLVFLVWAMLLLSSTKDWLTLFLRRGHLVYSTVMSWLCCRISYSLLCSAIMCLRRARSHQGCPFSLRALDLALTEGQFYTYIYMFSNCVSYSLLEIQPQSCSKKSKKFKNCGVEIL